MYTISKTFHFEAAHQLQDWPTDHQCSRLHGHSYTMEVVLSRNFLSPPPKEGVVYDYGDISKICKEKIINIFDHQNLNEILNIRNVTAEFLAHLCFNTLKPYIEVLDSITIRETPNSSATYSPMVAS